MEKVKHDCYNCTFREKIKGDAHSKCNAEITKNDVKAIWNQWSVQFPNNFDTHWIIKCKKFNAINKATK